MAVYWVDPCIGPGFDGITEACHGTTGTAKTGTYTNPWGLDEMYNTSYSNPLGLVNGDEVRIKGEPDSFWWSSSTWNVRGQDRYINTSTTSSDSYFYLHNGNGVTRPDAPFNTAGGAATNNSLFMVNNTSDFHTGWDDRIMFAASKYSSTGLTGPTTDPHAITMAYLSSASNIWQAPSSGTYATTASTNPEVELKWCEKIPSNTSSSSNRYFLGIYIYNVTSGGSSVSGKLVMGGVTVTDGWSSETAQTAGYYSILFAPFAHNTSSSGRSFYMVVGPISMRNCYILGWRTANQYYSRHAGGYFNLEGCQKPGYNINSPGSSVYTQTIYMPSMYGTSIVDNTSYNSSYSDAKYNDLRFGTLGMIQYQFRNRAMGLGSNYQSNHTDYEQKHVERLLLTRYNLQNIIISYTPTSNRPGYIADAASASGTNGMHFGDIIAVPRLDDNSAKSIFKLSTDQVTIRLKDNSVYCSTAAPFVAPGEASSKAPLNWHAGSNLQNAPTHSDFAQWPYAGEQSPGPICFSQSEASNTCPRNVIDASQTDFYSLNQITVPMADSGAQTYTAGRINFVNADAGLFDKNILSNQHYHNNANHMAQLIFKESNLTENSGGPVLYGGEYNSVVSGTGRGCFAYTNSDNELVIIPNRDPSVTGCYALFYLPTTIPDMSSATSLTTTVTFYVSNWYSLSGSNELLVQYKPIAHMSADGTITTASGYAYRYSTNALPTQSNPQTQSYTRPINTSGDIHPVTTSSINPSVAYIAVGIYMSDNTSLSANSRLIIKSLTVTVS